jgi:outer membrane protein OmpA-like peptidoglycan-associated protein
MKCQIFLALFLCFVVALPGLAQTSSSSPSQPAAAQTAPSPQTQETPTFDPLPPPDTDFWEGDEPNLGNLITHSVTTKKYVKKQIAPIQDRLNELEQLTATNTQMIKDVDARSQQGIQLASQKVSDADQHTADATNKAQAASLAAGQLTTRVSSAEQTAGGFGQYKEGAQTELRFRPGESVLSKQAKDALDQMASPLKDQHGYVIEVRSYAPGHGQTAIANSQKMADAVVRYLVLNHQIPLYRIHVLGLGNATSADSGAKHTSGGRVEISLLQNDVMGSTQH